MTCRGARDFAAGTIASGQCHRLDARIFDHRPRLIGLNEQCLENAFIKAGTPEDILNRQRTLRHIGSMFEQANISRHQSRRGETEDLPERKIPRHDGEDWSKRLITNETAGGARLHGPIL